MTRTVDQTMLLGLSISEVVYAASFLYILLLYYILSSVLGGKGDHRTLFFVGLLWHGVLLLYFSVYHVASFDIVKCTIMYIIPPVVLFQF